MSISLGNNAENTGFHGQVESTILTIQDADDYIVALLSAESANASTLTLDPGGANEASFTSAVQLSPFGEPSVGSGGAGIWHLSGSSIPAAGDYTVEVDWGVDPGSGSLYVRALQGAADQAPEATSSSRNGGVTSASTDITTQTDGALVVDSMSVDVAVAESVGADQTVEKASEASGDHLGSRQSVPVAGTATMSWSWSSSAEYIQVVAAIAPASGGGGSTAITGTLAGTSSDSAAASLNVDIAGTLAGTSSDSATVTTITDISGTVTDGGSAVQGALVYLIDQGSDTVYGTQTTDANGDYRFTDVPTGTYHAVVEQSGNQAASQPDLTVP